MRQPHSGWYGRGQRQKSSSGRRVRIPAATIRLNVKIKKTTAFRHEVAQILCLKFRWVLTEGQHVDLPNRSTKDAIR